jgi:integrase/recombinase XerD
LIYLRSLESETEVPGTGLLASVRRRKPFLFSSEQIQELMAAAAAVRPTGSLRAHSREALIGLLASTGLRVGEVLRLSLEDVHLSATPPHLVVRCSKFGKSRLVPIHASTAAKLREYITRREGLQHLQSTSLLLISEQGPLRYHTLLVWFRRLIRRLGIQANDGGRQPCLHSLRHGFAINRLLAWHKDGVDVRAWMPHLSTYLGHVSPVESYWYLTATPELLTTASDSFECYPGTGETK